MSKNLRGLSAREGLDNSLYEEIVGASKKGYEKSDSNLKRVAGDFLIGHSTVLGVSSFYEFLRTEHAGKKVFICDGTACLTSGKQETLRSELQNHFKAGEIGTVTCLGHCHTNNAFLYNHHTWSTDDLGKLGLLLKSEEGMVPEFNTGTNSGTPAMMDPITDIESYYQTIISHAGEHQRAIEEITLSGLRGRGGAGFPYHIKVKSAREATGNKKYVVCNADEGDPGAFSDKWLLEERTHSVLAGMMITGFLIGADEGVLYIRGEYPESVSAAKVAVEQLMKAGLLGENIRGTGLSFRFHVVEGSGAYICGEETSLLNSLEGLRPEVRTRPPFPAVYGLFGKPTVLSNVETFANLRFILNQGGKTWAAMGTEKSAGTKLVSLDGAFRKPGIYEVKMGTPLRYVLDTLGGGTRYPVKAFQIGGPLGGLVPATKVDDLTLDFESFAAAGFLLGHAGVVSIPEDFPIAELLSHLFEFTARESCGKCFPCRIGSHRGHELLERAIRHGEKIDRELFDDLLETLQIGSLCALGGGLPLPVQNALKYFSDELAPHFTTN
jgi:NADH:ubiquinone oxidoreductase subunit F (NADH-binding)